MPSPRRFRFAIITIVVFITFVIYVRQGPSMTTNSEFYKRTVSRMEAHARGTASESYQQQLAEAQQRIKKDVQDNTAQQGQQQHQEQQGGTEEHKQNQPPPPVNERLKQRLREAEQLAKKSADDKYRALKDIEHEVSRERAERELLEDPRGVGQKMPNPDTAASKEAEEARARAHADEVTLRATYNELTSHSPITIFSKSYCPHSARAKRILLQAFDIKPRPYIVELDMHPRGQELQSLLHHKTGRRTVPNVMVDGQSLGGGDEMNELWGDGSMAERLRDAGRKAIKSVTQKIAFGGDFPAEVPR